MFAVVKSHEAVNSLVKWSWKHAFSFFFFVFLLFLLHIWAYSFNMLIDFCKQSDSRNRKQHFNAEERIWIVKAHTWIDNYQIIHTQCGVHVRVHFINIWMVMYATQWRAIQCQCECDRIHFNEQQHQQPCDSAPDLCLQTCILFNIYAQLKKKHRQHHRSINRKTHDHLTNKVRARVFISTFFKEPYFIAYARRVNH